MKASTISLACGRPGRAAKILAMLVFLGWTGNGVAQQYVSTEDRSRFQEQPYKQAEAGMLPPSEYIAIAEKALRARYPSVTLSKSYEDGVVTRRFYHNAPAADRDIICVQFVFRRPLGGGGSRSRGFIQQNPNQPVPVLQALIRKDRTKIYVNSIRYRHQ